MRNGEGYNVDFIANKRANTVRPYYGVTRKTLFLIMSIRLQKICVDQGSLGAIYLLRKYGAVSEAD